MADLTPTTVSDRIAIRRDRTTEDIAEGWTLDIGYGAILYRRGALVQSFSIEAGCEAYVQSRINAAQSALEERLFEAEAIIEERDDRLALVDRIADLIGLPHDQELNQVAFELWFQALPAPSSNGGDHG